MQKFFVSTLMVLAGAVTFGQSGADLKLNLEKNKVYKLSSSSEQTIVQTVNGNQQTVESKSVYAISLKMMDVAKEFMVTEVRFDSMSTTTNTMGKVIKMSSSSQGDIKSSETSEIMSYVMNRLSKTPVYAKIDFTGKVLELVNGKMVSDMIARDTSNLTLTGPVAAALKTQIVNMVGDNSLKTLIAMFTHFLPGKSVNKGESWEITNTSNSGGLSLDIVTTYRLDAIAANNANVTAESVIRTAANAVPMKQGGATITYDDIKGLSKSTMSVDPGTGLVIESNAKSHISGNLGLSMPGVSMTIPMDINSNSKVISLQ